MKQDVDCLSNVSREALAKLRIYHDLVLKWQKAINLVSRETLSHVWERHILDSLQISDYIFGKNVLDIGSGGGFPGMVLAIAGDFRVTCVDSDQRKILFLREVARITQTKLEVIPARVEVLQNMDFDTICARGFSGLPSLLKIMTRFPSVKQGVFLKGLKAEDEIKKAELLFDFQYKIHQSNTDERGKIVIVNSVKEKI